jgi:hypothetical protein
VLEPANAIAGAREDPLDCPGAAARRTLFSGSLALIDVRQHLGMLGLAAVMTIVCGCTREPEAFLCPDVEEGELVVSELRGPQSGVDTWGQWIELFNASGADVDLYGLRVTFVPGDGSEADAFLVRTEPVEVPLGAYVVLGRDDDRTRPAHMDYGYELDVASDLPPSGKIEVEACGELLDSMTYRELPVLGTLALDGALEPTAAVNDEPANLCGDATEPSPDGPQTELGVPGTPGEANRPCP